MSNNITGISYKESVNEMTVTFGGGSVIMYRPVDQDAYTDLIKSDCLTSAVHSLIRNGCLVGTRRADG